MRHDARSQMRILADFHMRNNLILQTWKQEMNMEDKAQGLLETFLRSVCDRIARQERKQQDAELARIRERLGAQDIKDIDIAEIIRRRKEGKST